MDLLEGRVVSLRQAENKEIQLVNGEQLDKTVPASDRTIRSTILIQQNDEVREQRRPTNVGLRE